MNETNTSNIAEGGNRQPQQHHRQQRQIPSHRTIDPDFKKMLQRCLRIQGDNDLFNALSNKGINDWDVFQLSRPHHFKELNTNNSIYRDALVNLRRWMDYKISRDENGADDMPSYNFEGLQKFLAQESNTNNRSNDNSAGRIVTTATIEYDTIHFDKINEKILKSEDEKGTLQMGWRREGRKFFHIPIFLREDLFGMKKKLDNLMSSSKKHNLYISGPPGSGKTTYILFYFMLYVKKKKKKGLLVQYRENGISEVMILEEGTIRRVSTETAVHEISKLVGKIVTCEGKTSFDFYVFDGVRQNQDLCKHIQSSIEVHKTIESKYIAVTSLEFDIKLGDAVFGNRGFGLTHSVSSWEKEDYVKAMNAGLLKFSMNLDKRTFSFESELEKDNENDNMDLEALLERKYFYAGGSARYMFEFSIEDLISTVFKKLFDRMSAQDWEAFATLSITPGTPFSVSSGMQLIKEKYIPVSEYILRIAHKKCKSKLTSSLRAAADSSDNPALKGWAFELEQLDIIERMAKEDPNILKSEDNDLVLPIYSKNMAAFDGSKITALDGGEITGSDNYDSFTIWCSRWNQGCFDVAFYLDKHLITVNFTISKSHSLKIKPISDLRSALISSEKEVNKLTHIAVIQDSKFTGFKFGKPEGVGRATKSVLFSLNTAWSKKLRADINHNRQDNSGCYGKSLKKINVYDKWRSSRKRKQTGHFEPR